MTLTAGKKLGRYEIRAKIGEGGMGEVYLAQDTKLDRKVAIKVLPSEVANDKKRMQRFTQEAKAASALNHPNILTIYEIGEAGSSPASGSPAGGAVKEGLVQFIATEYVEGVTLRDRIASKEQLKLSEALEIAAQVASALAAAHEAGIIHRDIKPDNLMLRKDGFVKVLDFGLAKLTAPTGSETDSEAETRTRVNTEPGVVIGTVAYMSPEQARGLRVDARTDIWSLGVVLYEMIAGRVPFEGKDVHRQIIAIQEQHASHLSRHAEGVPERLEEIVAKTLAKDAEERYQTAKDLMIDLRSLKRKLEVAAEIDRTSPPEMRSTSSEPESSGDPAVVSTAQGSAMPTTTIESTRTASSAGHFVAGIKRPRVLGVIALLVVVSGVIGLVFYLRTRPSNVAINSIAVLPFTNTGGNAETEYLSDGICESLINSLSKIPNVKVMSRNSVFRFKGKETDALEVAHALGVRAVLTGKVTQQADNLSISVELVDAFDNSHLWGEQYNRKLSNLLGIQEDIVREVSDRLRVKLSGAEQKQVTRQYTDNAEAYQLYLKGRFFWNKFTPTDHRRAAGYFDQALAKDPTYALAYVGIADTYGASATNGWLPPRESYIRGKAAAKKALEIDDTLAEAHASLGAHLMFYDLDFPAAEREYKRALELNSNYILTYEVYSYLCTATGRSNEAIKMAQRGLEIDSLSGTLSDDVASAYYYAREFNLAMNQYKKSLEVEPARSEGHLALGMVYLQKGMYEEAIAESRKAIDLSERTSGKLGILGYAYAKSGKRAEALKMLNELNEMSRQQYVSPYDVAILLTGLGEKDKALEQLNKAYEDRAGWLIYLKVEPLFDPLRSDSRFADLVRRIGVPN